MLRFILHKLINKKWMAICLLIGNLLLIAVAASNPIYSDAVLQRTLTRTLSQKLTDTNTYPAEITLKSSIIATNVNDSTLAQFEKTLRKQGALCLLYTSCGILSIEVPAFSMYN